MKTVFPLSAKDKKVHQAQSCDFLKPRMIKLTLFWIKTRILVSVRLPLPSTPAKLGLGVSAEAELIMGVKRRVS